MRLVGDRRVAPNPLPRAWAVLAQITARTSALFRLHRWPDSSAFRPLHSLTHSASPTSLDALAHSDGRKLPRPALTAAHPKLTTEAAMLRISAKHRNMAARLRPARTPVIRREASPIAEDISINREHGACCSSVAKHADLTDQTTLV